MPSYRSTALHNHTAIVWWVVAVTALTACRSAAVPDAHGNIEADEVLISAQTSGQLERFTVQEGLTVAAGDTVALVDTTQLAFELAQLDAQHRALGLQRQELGRHASGLAVQQEIAQRVLDRTLRLQRASAATSAQRDQAEREARVLTEQERGATLAIERIGAELQALEARRAATADRLRRAQVRNPVPGTVLVTYVHEGEVIQPGQPLYRVADLDTLTVRAYVTGNQLAAFRLGDAVTVNTDGADGGIQMHRGRISWVSPRAEFTPTPVQTREDRVDLVYAVKIRVPNPSGALKIGMPADITVRPAASSP